MRNAAPPPKKFGMKFEPGKQYKRNGENRHSYGAFVDIGGVDGMVHISELTWGRIKHPSEVVKVGDSADVYVISVDKEKKKISLGMKNRSEDPWEKFIGSYSVGSIVNVKVVKLMTFGAFAEIIRRGRTDSYFSNRQPQDRKARGRPLRRAEG
jgi:4-hydroxy-3-methylbut-2-enyl diphosphate reductase